MVGRSELEEISILHSQPTQLTFECSEWVKETLDNILAKLVMKLGKTSAQPNSVSKVLSHLGLYIFFFGGKEISLSLIFHHLYLRNT